MSITTITAQPSPTSRSAARQIAGVAHKTPVATSRTVDARTGATVFFKCENLQRGGAFKFRGAYNALSRPRCRRATPRRRHLLVGQSRAGDRAGRPGARHPARHRDADRCAGGRSGAPRKDTAAKSSSYDREREDREAIGRRLASERGLSLIPPYDHPHIIAGQGTAARELIEEVGRARLSLRALRRRWAALRHGARRARAGARLPRHRRRAGRGRRCGAIVPDEEPADGQQSENRRRRRAHAIAGRTHTPPRPRTRRRRRHRRRSDAAAHDVLSVGAVEAGRSSPTGALGAAAALEGTTSIRGARVGVILSGGNVDLTQIASWLALP